MRTWTLYVCHACGFVTNEETDNLACYQCGEPRSYVETVDVKEVPREP